MPRPAAGNDDKILGAIIREVRTTISMSQEELGHAVGVSYQQIQKYETGANRLSVSRAYQIAQALKVPFSRLIQDFVDKKENPNG